MPSLSGRFKKALVDSLVVLAMRHALNKHPEFCSKITEMNRDSVVAILNDFRNRNSREQISDNVFLEEYYEFLEAYLGGKKVDAVMELAQAIQVLYRTMDVLLDELTEDEEFELLNCMMSAETYKEPIDNN